MMDMGDRASRRGAADFGLPLMIVAFLAILGFLYWLNLQARAERAAQEAAVAEEAVAEETVDVSSAVAILASDLQGDVSSLVGTMVRVEQVPLVSTVGTQGFWIELPNRNPFLISLSDGAKAAAANAAVGQSVSVTGIIRAMEAATLDAWSVAGTISEGDRLAAEFATHYLDVILFQSAGTGGEG
jgi:cbb3-type cytochrome oxidase subunit 3